MALPQRGGLRRSTWSAIASTVVITLVAGMVVFLAWRSEGFPATDVKLNAGTLWVTDPGRGVAGTLNPRISELTGAVKSKESAFDVVQDGDEAFLVSDAALAPLDDAQMKLGDQVTLDAGTSVSMGGGVLAAVDASKGNLHITPASAPAGLAAGSPVIAELGPGAVVTVGRNGTVHAFSPKDNELISYGIDAHGAVSEKSRSKIEGVGSGDHLQIAAVGSTPVLLDATKARVLTADESFDTGNANPDNIALQLSSDNGDIVYATDTHVVEQPLDGSAAKVEEVEGAGPHPARPAVVAGCLHAAWQSGTYVRDCGSNLEYLGPARTETPAAQAPVFRVNRDLVALNGVSGDLWVPRQNLKLVDNWDDVIPPDLQTDEHDDQSLRRSDAWTTPDRQQGNLPPVARDDNFGARSGRTTILTVLDNDSDPDGDVLTVRPVNPEPGVGVARGGTALQITLEPEASGERTFEYEVSDGLGGTDIGAVTVSIHGAEVNEPPTSKRPTNLIVAAGKTVRYNALNDWIDPDGDSVIGSGAESPGGDDVQLLANGLFTFTDTTKTPGVRQVPITMSDGRKATSGVITVTVKPADQVLPVANADHVTIAVGRVATLKPLANDADPGDGELRLAKVGEIPEVTLTPDFPTGSVKVSSTTVGTFYTAYVVTDGPNTAQGLIRVDVIAPQDDSVPPVAANDVALVGAGRETLVDVLANDSDPNERVLVVQSIEVPPNSGINVAVVQHRVLRISDSSGFDQPITVKYTVSNGTASAVGNVDVVPLTPPVNPRPPVAESDEAVVRAGDVVTIDVLDNDNHPDGDDMHVAPKLAEAIEPAAGTMFVAQDALRMKAGNTPGTYHAVYTVLDSHGQSDSAQVTVHVLARDDAANTAPKPRTITARALAGSTVRIPVNTNGIDAEGDSVTLTGTAGAPQKGVIAAVGNGWIDYTALDDANGTDSFDYTVADRLGRAATGRIDVGVAPKNPQNQLPSAVDDRVTARPDRHLSVPVLNNDSDPDGDHIKLPDDAIGDEPGAGKLAAHVSGSNVDLETPSEAGTYTFTYSIIDERGARGRATLSVTVDPNAPLAAPIATDDFVSVADLVSGGKVQDEVEVPLLDNDSDPDGSASDFDVESKESAVKSISDGKATVAVADDPQVLLYTVTDADDQTSSAFIHVPGRTSVGPTLRDRKVVEIPNNQNREFKLDDTLVVRPSHSPRITTDQKVSALHADGGALVVDGTTLSFRCAKQYVGDAALTFEATDGTGPDDPDGKVATLTIPLRCMPTENQPPKFSGTTVELAQGDPVTVDLSALADDPDRDDLEFGVGTVPAGVSASLDGHTLTVSTTSAPVGTQVSIPVTATDGNSAPVQAAVVARVTTSNRPLPVANPDQVLDAKAGATSNVDALANDFNPFPDKQLTIVSAGVQSGNGTANVSGSQVAVTPATGFIGNMTVTYRIADSTGDPSRQASGTITVTVRDKPSAPGTPSVQGVQSGSVVLSWSAPADNGAPITGYTVRGTGGFSQSCAQTTCTLTGLTNGTSYTFTVTATNAVGESAPSPSSAAATPDAKPDTPSAPTLTPGDASVQVSWSAPNSSGSPITSYTLEISPAPASGGSQKTGVTGTSVNWTGLENGVPYQVRVQAHNSAPDPSEWSPYSAAATPAGKPQTPAAPTASRSTSAVNGGVIDVSWTAPDSNGAEITAYRLLQFSGGGTASKSTPVSGSQTSMQVTGLSTTAEYTFAIVATNRVGDSAQSPESSPIKAFGLPGSVSAVTATPGDQQATLSYSAPADNGSPITSYEVSINGGGWQSFSGSSSGGAVTGLTNGTAYTFKVRGVNAAGSGPDGGTSGSVTPFGAPKAPQASGSANGKSVTFTWSTDTNAIKNGRDITTFDVTFDGTAVTNNGSYTGGNGYGQLHKLHIKVCASEGGCAESDAQATSVSAPTSWPTTTNRGQGGTCPEADLSPPIARHETPAGSGTYTCDPPGFIPDGTALTIVCYTGAFAAEPIWFRISGGTYSGYYVSGRTTAQGTTPPDGMPACG